MAMGITQALKLQEGPIDALARLSQQQLIAMVQQKRLGADVLPIVLNEKAQMAQQAANMQAAAAGQQPSVTEKNMAINAQAEAHPSQMPQETMGGIADLPIPDNLYTSGDDGYAGGGIVAFEGGGSTSPWVDRGGLNVLAEETNPPRAGGIGLSDYVRQYQDLMAPYRQLSEEERAAMAFKGRSPEDIRQQNWMRVLEAGLGIMGGQSPYAFTNIGQGSQAALKGYAEDIKERRKEEMALAQTKAEMARRRREEQMADVTGGLGLFKEAKAEERASLERESRENIAKLDRDNRMAIAMIPDKAMQVAAELRKKDPNLSYLDSITQASQALTPKDTYNATRTAVSAAAKDANTEFMQRATFDPKLQEDMKKAAQGDKDAQARVKAIKDKIQQETFRLYQVQGVDLSGGRMGSTNLEDPLGIRR